MAVSVTAKSNLAFGRPGQPNTKQAAAAAATAAAPTCQRPTTQQQPKDQPTDASRPRKRTLQRRKEKK